MDSKSMFSFVTIAYNHEKYIISHLESIKYQIQSYGMGYTFQLIVADDCSKDRTIELINLWIEKNRFLFETIDIISNASNMGTCKNYCNGLRRIEGDYYKVLAGDDLYAKDNIFKCFELLDEFDIVLTPVGAFRNNNLIKDKTMLSRIFSIYDVGLREYRHLSKWFEPLPMAPGVFIKKGIITEEIMQFIEQFTLIEDRSQSIKMYETYENLKIGILERICVLYRHHDKAVTKTKDKDITQIFNYDSNALYRYVIKTTTNYVVKADHYYQLFLSRLRFKKIATMLNYRIWSYRIRFLFSFYKYREKMNSIINDSYLINQEHIKYLNQMSSLLLQHVCK